MNEDKDLTVVTPFERIKRTNQSGNEFWSSRDFAEVLGYTDYRNFESVIEKARTACFNSGQRVEDHFVEITEMIEIGKGGRRPVRTVSLGSGERLLRLRPAHYSSRLEPYYHLSIVITVSVCFCLCRNVI